MIDKNSMLHWFPLIRNLAIPQPNTMIVEAGFLKDGWEWVLEAGRKLRYPLFLRTDLMSGKHGWIKTCYVEKEADLSDHIEALKEESRCCDMIGRPVRAIVFREYIEMDSAFVAFDGLPISRERRYFVDGEVRCHHPYWPEAAIRFWSVHPDNWQELLAEISVEDEEEIALLTGYANKVAGVLDGYWSVDFCRGRNGVWYLIDCALGADSWHPECNAS